MNRNQKTIGREGSVSGIGIHSGQTATVLLKPAAAGSGIQFFKNGARLRFSLSDDRDVSASADGKVNLRCSSVGQEDLRILTVEHLLAALCGLEITNIEIHVDGAEVPGLDGSALPFVKLLKSLGIVEQAAVRDVYRISEPIFCYGPHSAISVYPDERFSVAYTMDYDHPQLRNQRVDFTLDADLFENEIAPARTFCTENEALELKKRGFGRGADYGNTLVISQKGVAGNRLRFPDECARHKVLDILGDLNLLGFSIVGRVVGLRSGHALNQKLVEEIKKQKRAYE